MRYAALILYLLFLSGVGSTALAQESSRVTLSGFVRDAQSGEALIGASVYVKELQKGVSANAYGFYSITLDKGSYNLIVNYLGYTEKRFELVMQADRSMPIELDPVAIQTAEVTIAAERKDRNVQAAEMGRVELEVDQIQRLPALFGEVDLLKAIQLLPGVRSAGEGNSGFYVRGGGPDQNLILLDEGVVYNASHLFGFFSVFNPDAVKTMTLTKGGMPAQYGGRLASVLDISMKEGNAREFKARGGIGYIASRLTLEGPIVKDRGSFIVSGRRTFIDLFLREPFISSTSNIAGNGYYFFDLNTKLNYRIGERDRL